MDAIHVLFDPETGRPHTVLDGEALIFRKTAADTALGVRLLAPKGARWLLMIGAGALAPYLIEAVRAVRPSIEEISSISARGKVPPPPADQITLFKNASAAHLDLITATFVNSNLSASEPRRLRVLSKGDETMPIEIRGLSGQTWLIFPKFHTL